MLGFGANAIVHHVKFNKVEDAASGEPPRKRARTEELSGESVAHALGAIEIFKELSPAELSGMVPALVEASYAAGAPIDAMDGKKQSAHDLCVKAMPDSHAPELLSDVLLPKDQLKKSVNVVKAVGKMQALTRSSKVHPAGGEAKAANKYAVAVTAE